MKDSVGTGAILKKLSGGSMFVNNTVNTTIGGGKATDGQDLDANGLYIVDSDSVAINGNKFTDINKHGVVIKDCNKGTFKNNTIARIEENGLWVENVGGMTIYDNKISNAKKNGAVLKKSSGTASGGYFTKQTIKNSGENGLYVDGITNMTIDSNTIDTSGTYGATIKGVTKGIFEKNTIKNSSEHGMHIQDTTNLTVSNNTISDSEKCGVYIHDVSGGSFSNNTIQRSKHEKQGVGLWVKNTTGLAITSNTIQNSKSHGAYLDGNVKGGSFDKNNIKGSGQNGVRADAKDGSVNTVPITNNTAIENEKYDYVIIGASTEVVFKNNKCGDTGLPYPKGDLALVSKNSTSSGNHNVHYQQTNATISALSNTSNGVKITWKAETADYIKGYMIYRKTGSGSWSLIKTIDGKGTTSYVDTTAKNGTTYTYVVTTVYKYYDQCTAAADKDTKTIKCSR